MTQRDVITRAGWQALNNELGHLWREHRPHVVKKLADAAAEGDRSENAEYIYRKKELREIDRRLRYLRGRLEVLSIADALPAETARVFFGAWVDVRDETDKPRRYRIVGADETAANDGWISMHSPVARALLGRCVGDEVEVEVPGQRRALRIEAIAYAPPEPPLD